MFPRPENQVCASALAHASCFRPCCAPQIAFTEIPNFRFSLRLLGGNVTSLPFLEEWLTGVVRSLLEPYTLPEKVRPCRPWPACRGNKSCGCVPLRPHPPQGGQQASLLDLWFMRVTQAVGVASHKQSE